MNTGISPGAKWFTLCLPFFQYLFFHCKFTISISVSVCRCKSKVAQSQKSTRSVADSASEMRYSESNRATTVVCCGGAVRVVMFDILYGSVYLKLNVGKWVA